MDCKEILEVRKFRAGFMMFGSIAMTIVSFIIGRLFSMDSGYDRLSWIVTCFIFSLSSMFFFGLWLGLRMSLKEMKNDGE